MTPIVKGILVIGTISAIILLSVGIYYTVNKETCSDTPSPSPSPTPIPNDVVKITHSPHRIPLTQSQNVSETAGNNGSDCDENKTQKTGYILMSVALLLFALVVIVFSFAW